MQQFLQQPLSKAKCRKVQQALTYFTNHESLMNYAAHVQRNLPIGSGVTEAAAAVLTLRTLSYSTGRWAQFWQKVDQYGISLAA